MTLSIDLSKLPAPQVVETLSYEEILAERKESLLALIDVDQREAVEAALVLESEPITKLLQESAYREMVLRNRINDAARAIMLAFAGTADLDQLAGNFNLTRLIVKPADNSTVPPTPAVMESDDALRERILMAFDGLSVAGPRSAYIKHARDADGRVADATAISPDPAEVIVTIQAIEGNGSAPADLINTVDTYLSDEDRRPLGDRLTVQGAEILDYEIVATLYFRTSGPEAELAMMAADENVTAYSQQRRRLGRKVSRAGIIAALKVEGVEDVDLVSPAANIPVSKTQASYCTGITLLDGGSDD